MRRRVLVLRAGGGGMVGECWGYGLGKWGAGYVGMG